MHPFKLLFSLLFMMLPQWITAQEAATVDTLVIGTKITAPFVLEHEDGSIHGLSIDLWRSIAWDLGTQYEMRMYDDIPALVAAVKREEVDMAVAALSITDERERDLDFTVPFYVAALQIATRKESGGPLATLKRFFSLQFIQAVGALFMIIFVFGFLMWLLERRRNPDQFGKGWYGLGAGFWWSAVTMTTVGYGDKAPVTWLGRGLAIIWMFLALIIFSGLTAAITSALTVDQLSVHVNGPDQLKDVDVGTVEGSNTVDYLAERRIRPILYATPDDALAALEEGRIEAVVYDGPILQHLLHNGQYNDLKLLPNQLQQYYYGIALPPGSVLRDTLSVHVLQKMAAPEWKDWIFKYMGRHGE